MTWVHVTAGVVDAIGSAAESVGVGQTTFSEALALLSMRSMLNFDEYARRLGVA